MKLPWIVLLVLLPWASALGQEIPITTTSDEARAYFVQGLESVERLRIVEAKALFEKAVAKDPIFARAWYRLAFLQNSPTGSLEILRKARTASLHASIGEQLLINATFAGVEDQVDAERRILDSLVMLYPNDKRAYNNRGDFLQFTMNDYAASIPDYEKAITIDPAYHVAYNALGYAYAQTGNFDQGEKILKQYVSLLPDDANPHDTYAEVLMKQGKFEESVAEYKKALAIDSTFHFSLIGVGTDYAFLGKAAEGRSYLATLVRLGATKNMRWQGMQATARSYLYDGDYEGALAAQRNSIAWSERNGDPVYAASDRLTLIVLLAETGKVDEAGKELHHVREIVRRSDFPPEMRKQVPQWLANTECLLALHMNNLKEASAKQEQLLSVAEHDGSVSGRSTAYRFAAEIALKQKHYDDALRDLQLADQRNARTLFLMGLVQKAMGDAQKAKASFTKAAHVNDLSWDFALVRKKAMEQLVELQ